MAEQTIIITIDENGKINAETTGLKGEMCIDELEKILEGESDMSSIKKTDEYYQQPIVKPKARIQNKNK